MRTFLSLIFAVCFNFTLNALEISVESGSFKNGDKTYLETYVRVLGRSAEFRELATKDGLFQASIDFTFIISQGGNIVTYEKFKLSSPELRASQDFLDVKRFAIDPGTYTLKIEAIDHNDPDNKMELIRSVIVRNYSKAIELTDVQLFGKVKQSTQSNPLAKNGIYMEPLNYGVVTEDINVLNIYAEVYLKNAGDDLLFVKYGISEGFDDGGGKEVMKKVKKLDNQASQPLIFHLPVDKIPTGNYRVELEIMDKSKTVIISKFVNFSRSNPEYDQEFWRTYNDIEDYSFVNDMTAGEVDYALRATSPIVFEPKKSLLDYIIKDAPLMAKKKFLFSFWKEKEPRNTEHHYQQYLTIAKAVDLEYNSNVGYGFETDRGYIFLRYGKPNSVLTIDQEPEAYPYEIWYFNQVEETTQTNVRFLFYNKSLVAKDYKLLHSTCRGETQNQAWEVELYARGLDVQEQNKIDAVQAGDGWNRKARQYFNEY
ncbi:MAG: GWxTD domain-containing protein [Saprospiraceae bacterium]|jgi:GWxTD domain-containing protein|tara:strand:- start:390 stop:1838 length:1449 start_codon:yes stop_codon:yes gene_type:complete